MVQLYLFLIALAALTLIFVRRYVLTNKEERFRFERKIKSKIKEIRQLQQEESKERFKDRHNQQKEENQFQFGKYKESLRRAEMAIAKEQWSNAKKLLIEALSLAKDELPASLKLADVYIRTNDFRRAETLYRRLLDNNIVNVEIYENLGTIFTKSKRYKEAIQAYVRTVELDEKNDKNFVALGKLYSLLMRYSLAAECFRRAAELKPREAEYLFLLANSCQYDEDYDNSLLAYEKILTIEPYNEKAKDASNEVRLKIKEYESLFGNESLKTPPKRQESLAI